MWESNPPGQLLATCIGVEDLGAHQHASIPIVGLVEITHLVYNTLKLSAIIKCNESAQKHVSICFTLYAKCATIDVNL